MAKGKTASSSNNTSEYNQKLQAILLTDTYTKEFYPFFHDKTTQPRSLIPLNHIPLISYTLDVLSTVPDIEEIYIFLSSTILQEYITVNYIQNKKYPHLKFHCILEPHIYNVGDALREIDRRGVIRSDPFLLLTSGFVSNIDLSIVIQEHIERRKKDSSCILTLVLRRSKDEINDVEGGLMVGLDENSNRILVYDTIDKLSTTASSSCTSIPCSFFASHSSITLRHDLRDVGLYICSPDVLARFSDAFDCTHFRQDFIRNSVSEEEEALQNKIFAYLLPPSQYAHFVKDWKTYHKIGRDLLYRWCDFVNMRGSGSGGMYRKYQMCSYFVYKEIAGDDSSSGRNALAKRTKKLDRSAIVKNGCMIGLHSSIGTNSCIVSTVIGRNCDIKSNVKISKSHVWDNVLIEDNVHIAHSVLSDYVIIKSGARISKGCVIGKGCIIGTNVTLPEYTRVVAFDVTTIDKGLSNNADWSSSEDDDDSEDDWSEEEEQDKNNNDKEEQETLPFQSDSTIVGIDGLGQQWKPTHQSDDNDDDDSSDDTPNKEEQRNEAALQRMNTQSIGYDAKPIYEQYLYKLSQDVLTTNDDEYVTEDEDELDPTTTNTSTDPSYIQSQQQQNSNISSLLDKDGFLIQGRQKGVNVIKELKEICVDHDTTNTDSNHVDHLMIELNGYKFSQNATFSDVVIAVIYAIFQRMKISEGSDLTAVGLLSMLTNELDSWGNAVLHKLCYSLEEEKNIIYTLEHIGSSIDSGGNDFSNEWITKVVSTAPTFRLVLQKMHDLEIISDECILEWASERTNNAEDLVTNALFLQKPTQDFLSWLEEESESESEED